MYQLDSRYTVCIVCQRDNHYNASSCSDIDIGIGYWCWWRPVLLENIGSLC